MNIIKFKYKRRLNLITVNPAIVPPPLTIEQGRFILGGGSNTEFLLFKIFKNFMKYNNLNLFI